MGGAVPLPLTRHSAIKLLREAARQSGRIVFLDHAVKRMRERRITRSQVARVLATGSLTEGPVQDPRGRWSARVEGRAEGRPLGVAVGFEAPGVVVITAFWME
jgi:hypothetical protein